MPVTVAPPGTSELTVDVRVDHHPPGVGLDLPETRRVGHEAFADIPHPSARIVDQDVQRAELTQRCVDDALCIGLTGDIGDHWEDCAFGRLGRQRLDFAALARHRCHHADVGTRQA